MHNRESVRENETHKLLWDFEIQTDPLISARRSGQVKITKKRKTWWIVYLAILADLRKKWKKTKRKISTWTFLGNWKTVEQESDGYTNFKGCTLYSHQTIGTGTVGLRNNRKSGGYPNYSIIEIRQNTEKSPGDWRGLVVTHSPLVIYQLVLS